MTKPDYPYYPYYILKDKKPIQIKDLLLWAKWFEKADRHVKDEKIGDVRISTVFLGIDDNYGLNGPPILFETMIFGGPLDGEMWQYETWDDALKGHKRVVREVMKHNTKD